VPSSYWITLYKLFAFFFFAIVLQDVADADKKFRTVEVGGRGKQSDGGTFCGSTLFRLLVNVPPPQALPG